MGLMNNIINRLPIELHIPGYRYCGPGTKLRKRLARGDPGINPLDEACKRHDIAYSESPDDLSKRHEADRILADAAWERAKSNDAGFGEKAAAWAVTNAMKAKVKLGWGMAIKKPKKIGEKKCVKRGAGLKVRKTSFNHLLKTAKLAIKRSKAGTVKDMIGAAVRAAKREVSPTASSSSLPRVIPVPKRGGILPLIPIFAGLSALGAMAGGTATIAKAVKDARMAEKNLAEAQKHNRTMEAIALGKGMFVRPYKRGYGLFVRSGRKN